MSEPFTIGNDSREKEYVLLKDLAFVNQLAMVPSHSIGGPEKKDPKFVMRVLKPGSGPSARPVPMRVNLGHRIRMRQARQPAKVEQNPRWRANLSDDARKVFDKHNTTVINTLCTVAPGKCWKTEGGKLTEATIENIPEHYVKHAFPRDWARFVKDCGLESEGKKKGAKPVSEWTVAEKEALAKAVNGFLVDVDEQSGKTQLKLASDGSSVMWTLKNWSKGGPILDDNRQPLEQTMVKRWNESTKTMEATDPQTFINDMTCAQGHNPKSADVWLYLSHKHVYSSNSMSSLSDMWHADYIAYKPPTSAVLMEEPDMSDDEIQASKKRDRDHDEAGGAAKKPAAAEAKQVETEAKLVETEAKPAESEVKPVETEAKPPKATYDDDFGSEDLDD